MVDTLESNLLGSSPQFAHVIAQIRRIAKFDVTVLIGGETGTGKELGARAVHYLSARAAQPFIPVNCGALAETLIESELFGHERGAFTDARQAAPGLISEAEGGTLFLDEIDTLSPKAQAALLRFLQDRTYRRVGGTQTRHTDVRLIAASNANLEELVEARQFRRDLLYRLKVMPLVMPPLRERGNDVTELARIFLDRLNREYSRQFQPKRFHPEFSAALGRYSWPGNIRELEHFIQREYLMCDSEVISAAVPRDQGAIPTPSDHFNAMFKQAKASVIADFERSYVSSTMARAQGNISRAARLAGQDRSAFSKLVSKYRVASTADQEQDSAE
ncbi:DNA-binding NtrC family response regulator [Luteibacter sp. Sphag1AF]|uniref:sigma-54 interaction domain-containing protein n=1 Tax=Luteibacter sp. Sphag1AF TaxID=2587031 RepID=UPI00160C04DF|nr:sigma 54-interacting transcriptional regulator [Luteibacter sp. Sphag1AF]MBB3228061.1 DNA-binding NtrC family response regulator [Luteibacter sp. Sphag1AF]